MLAPDWLTGVNPKLNHSLINENGKKCLMIYTYLQKVWSYRLQREELVEKEGDKTPPCVEM